MSSSASGTAVRASCDENEPVMPIADIILEFFERLGDGFGGSVVCARFGDVASVLRAFAKVVKVGFVELRHLVREAGKGFESDHGCGFRLAARCIGGHGLGGVFKGRFPIDDFTGALR